MDKLKKIIGLLTVNNQSYTSVGEEVELEDVGDNSKDLELPVESILNTDDPSIELNHWRTWTLTTAFVILFAGTNQFFTLRYPSLRVSYLIAQVIVYPIGKGLASFLPDKRFKNPWFNFNPGPYTIKEHGILTICVSLTASAPYATEIIVAQSQFYKKDFGVLYQLLLVWTTQSLGYGLAGLTRKFLVYPSSIAWPQTLINVAIFETLHEESSPVLTKRWKFSSYQFFLLVLFIAFIWHWIPGFFFTGLSYFNFVLWLPSLRDNFIANFFFGVKSGIGIIPLTFDYTQISQAVSGSVFVTPFWVVMNTYSAIIVFFIIVLPFLYFNNVWNAKYLPVISASTFDDKQNHYNVSSILNSDFTINKEQYLNYSPLFIPFSYLLSYSLNFAAVVSIFVHTYLHHGKEIWLKLNNAHHEERDIHNELMKSYKEVPDLWYGTLFITVLILSFFTVCYWETGLPWWGLLLALSISVFNFVPQGMLEGVTNQMVGLNVITELICGYILPYRPLANVLFKVYGFIVMRHGLSFSMDLKLGRYLKVPPILLFWIQLWSTFVAGLTTVGVQYWMTNNIKDICQPTQEDGFICQGGRTIYNASIIWSLPKHLFSPGQKYNALMWFFLLGLFTPFLTYYLHKKWPEKWFGRVNSPVFFAGPGNIPPSTPYNYGVYFFSAMILKMVKQKWPDWNKRYKLVLGAAIETGVALAVVIIFFLFQYNGWNLKWIGNNIWKETIDYRGESYLKLKPGETIGST